MNPADAEKRNLQNGQTVKIQSRVGELEIALEISDEIMAGVVSIPHGWGHHKQGIQLSVAREHAGVSINDLTDETVLDELSGNAAFSRTWVRIGEQ
jgi:anaerobic selenocysteine-containing dehydrogenase